MTTTRTVLQKATDTLAFIRFLHYYESEGERIALRHLEDARKNGIDWSWTLSGASLRLAYASIGYTLFPSEDDSYWGYEWHCGRHPIQRAEVDNEV